MTELQLNQWHQLNHCCHVAVYNVGCSKLPTGLIKGLIRQEKHVSTRTASGPPRPTMSDRGAHGSVMV